VRVDAAGYNARVAFEQELRAYLEGLESATSTNTLIVGDDFAFLRIYREIFENEGFAS
jgi:hypothetical protein